MIRALVKDGYTALLETELVPKSKDPIDMDNMDLQKLTDSFLDAVELVPIENEHLIPKKVGQLYNDIVDGVHSLDGNVTPATEPAEEPVTEPVGEPFSFHAPEEPAMVVDPKEGSSVVDEGLIASAQEQAAKELGFTEEKAAKKTEKVSSKATNIFGRRVSSKYGFIDSKLLEGVKKKDLIDLLVKDYGLEESKAKSVLNGHIRTTVHKKKWATLEEDGDFVKFIPTIGE